jgi:hypothetical protein
MKGRVLVFATVCALVFVGSLAAQSTPASEAFSWYGELIALDENARIMTVKSRVVGEAAMAEFRRLKSGERVMLTWSGFDKFSDAIRSTRPTAAGKSEERFTFPVDFVSIDEARQFVTFKVQIPESSIANLKSLKPGDWVTATSPHGPSAETASVVMVRPYVTSPTSGSN